MSALRQLTPVNLKARQLHSKIIVALCFICTLKPAANRSHRVCSTVQSMRITTMTTSTLRHRLYVIMHGHSLKIAPSILLDKIKEKCFFAVSNKLKLCKLV